MHKVKCTVCGKIFDRDRIQAVKAGARRYAHQTCLPQGEPVPLTVTEEELELIQLKEYVKNLLKDSYVPARVNKQIKEYKKEYNYTYTGMLKALVWFYEIKGNPVDKANGGIGIVPYIYTDARDYYYNLFLAKKILEESEIDTTKTETKYLSIQSPRAKLKKPKLFHFLDREDED